jgi:DNA-binding NtrC family response regulator
MPETILVVDDDPVQRRLVEEALKRIGHRTIVADGGEAGLRVLNSAEGKDVSLVVLDLVMPDLDGMGVLSRMKQAGIEKPTIVLTAQGGIDTVVSAMRAGAFDFVVKPVSVERLDVSIRNALKVDALQGEIQRINRRRDGALTFKDIVTRAPTMARVIDLGKRAAGSNIPILLEGESGVGKEMIARAIQGTSERRNKPFVTVNCGAIPANLVESILFGHEKGAFTGAQDKHTGKFVEAHTGTLFLDEIGELPLETQVKLLRAIQEGEIEPVGGRRPVKTDFRLISATNRTLVDLVKEGKFREDLYYRISVFPVWIPPLRDRLEDVSDLVKHFVSRFAAEEGKRIDGVTSDAMQLLSSYRWPGNVRQLENTIFRAVVLADRPVLDIGEFPQIAAQVSGFEPAALRPGDAPRVEAAPSAPPTIVPVEPVKPTLPPGVVAAPFGRQGQLSMLDEMGEVRTLEDIERDLLRYAIAHYRGNMTEVARRVGIGRSTLYRRLKELGLVAESAVAAE